MSADNMPPPKAVLVFSGKRKSGKDYVAEIVQKRYFIIMINNLQ